MYIVLLIALFLGACGSARESLQSEIKNKEYSIEDAGISKVTSENKTKPKPIASYIAPKPENIYPTLSYLAGLSRLHVMGLLGEPSFWRQDDPALIWQYKTISCALDIFLYKSEGRSEYQVNHFEIRNRNKHTLDARECFITLIKTHDRRHSG